MKRIIFAVLALLPGLVLASVGGFPLDKAEYDLSDKASLQRGAATFMNYCAGCHSTQYQRYNRVAADIGIPDDLMKENLVFTGAKIGDLMKSAMSEKDAARWFGAPPPDLTLVARVRGADWIYTYLRSFYVDETRPFGVNNAVFPSVGMPHVLWELQGTQVMDPATHKLSLAVPGKMSPAEYDKAVSDLVSFMVWMAEPQQEFRKTLGYIVLAFLALLFVVAYALKKEYWKDIH